MDGILLINKPKEWTSRDVVNKVSNIIGTKKVGHTGTLDPIATGVLIVTIGKATKLNDLLMTSQKEYHAKITFGIATDSLDITGNVIKLENNFDITNEKLDIILKEFIKTYNQEVPSFSAVKIAGKKLYEYAREGKIIELPKKEVTIYDIKRISDINNNEVWISCLVSKGTYIRSLIRDIGLSLNIPCTMSELVRTKQGRYDLKDCININEIDNNKIIPIAEIFKEYPKIKIALDKVKKIKNGMIFPSFFDSDYALLYDNDFLMAIYTHDNNDFSKVKPYIMF